ncbi:hypothetical protein KHC17_23930 (plasmid) [Agrobacterium salinitolerans]|uniref:hypothetical protein n=1 Tax=Agrobacterium salinitolerans TaxID=1183413 RepID=UPI001C241289|nr:hypothetical protein [Agrobacterium salinitolerans]QXC52233.1 hypothetical protein KHC17_23930 [Agrobacterium salinitolerans]
MVYNLNKAIRCVFFKIYTHVVPLIIFILCFFILFFTSNFHLNLYDEGIVLTGAYRVLHGDWPSRDFYTNYGPAQFFVVAAIYEFFGMTALASRVYDALVSAAIVTLVYCAIINTKNNMIILISLIWALFLLISYRIELYSLMPCMVLFLAGGIATERHLVDHPLHIANFSWAIAALIFLFRFDLGVAAAAAFGAPVAIVAFIDFFQGRVGLAVALSVVLRNASVALLWLFGAAFALWSMGILQPALNDLLSYNAGNYVQMRSLPFPKLASLRLDPVRTIVIYFPVLVVCFSLVGLWFTRLGNSGENRRKQIGIIVFISITVISYMKGFVRVSPEHLLIACVSACVLVSLVVDALTRPESQPSWIAKFSLSAVLLVAFIFTGRTVEARWNADLLFSGKRSQLLSSIFPFGSRGEVVDAAEFIASNTMPDERILSATGRHDKVFANDISLYFLAKRLPATRWHQYDPGVQTTAVVQAEMVEDIKRRNVRFIFQDRSFDDVDEKNGSSISSGVTLLDKYIAKQFKEVRRFGPISVLERRENDYVKP